MNSREFYSMQTDSPKSKMVPFHHLKAWICYWRWNYIRPPISFSTHSSAWCARCWPIPCFLFFLFCLLPEQGIFHYSFPTSACLHVYIAVAVHSAPRFHTHSPNQNGPGVLSSVNLPMVSRYKYHLEKKQSIPTPPSNALKWATSLAGPTAIPFHSKHPLPWKWLPHPGWY